MELIKGWININQYITPSRYQSASGVYKITNTINNKCYIGVSTDIWKRWINHKSILNKGIHYNKKLQNDWVLYQEKSFTIEILEKVNKENFQQKEQFWMDKYKCYLEEYGYNKQIISGHSINKFKA